MIQRLSQSIKTKLQSETGASITFALLLFLVCSVVSSILIVASTTAAGRIANTVKTDQRYYAVHSASELLIETIDMNGVTAVQSTVQESTDDDPVVTTKLYAEQILSNGINSADSLMNLMEGEDAEIEEVEETYSVLTDVINTLQTEDQEFPCVKHLTLTADGILDLPEGIGTDDVYEVLGLDIYEVIEEDGTLVFYVSKGAGEGKEYTMKITFEADREVRTYDKDRLDEDGEINGTIHIDATQITWKLTGAEKAVVPAVVRNHS